MKENRSKGSANYYEIFINGGLFNCLRRIRWGYLPHLIINVEEGKFNAYIHWK